MRKITRIPAGFVLATFCGLVLAGMVHVIVVFLVPHFAQKNAFSQLKSSADHDHSELVASTGGAKHWLGDVDPAAAIGACIFNLAEGPMRVLIRAGNLPQFLSFHNLQGGVFFAVTDRAAFRNILEVVIMTKEQLSLIEAAENEENPLRDLRIVAPDSEGLAIIRVLSPFPSQNSEANTLAQTMTCTVDPAPMR